MQPWSMRMHAKLKRWLAPAVVVVTIALAFPLAAEDAEAWLELPSGVFVDVDEARRLLDEGAVLLDARDSDAYEREHLSGARSAPWSHVVEGEKRGDVSTNDADLGERLAYWGLHGERTVIVAGAWRGTPEDPSWGEEGRVWWTLRYLGHRNVVVLYGGWRAARDAGWATEPGLDIQRLDLPPEEQFPPYPVERDAAIHADIEEVVAAAMQGTLLDTRNPVEFEGASLYGEERGGRVPGAQSAWWVSFFDAAGNLRSPDEVEARFAELGITRDETSVAYCTGGVRSGFVVLLAHALGYPMANYDGSMWEWSADPERPME